MFSLVTRWTSVREKKVKNIRVRLLKRKKITSQKKVKMVKDDLVNTVAGHSTDKSDSSFATQKLSWIII